MCPTLISFEHNTANNDPESGSIMTVAFDLAYLISDDFNQRRSLTDYFLVNTNYELTKGNTCKLEHFRFSKIIQIRD